MRVEPVAPERRTPEQRRAAETVSSQLGAPVRGPFAALLRTPELAEPFARLVGLSLSEGTSRVPLRLKELAIIVIARAFAAEYEWFIHAPRAAAHGVDGRAIEDIRRHRTPRHLGEDERLVHDLTREILATRRLCDASYARGLQEFGEEGMVELATLIGFYHAVSVVITAFDIEAPEGDPRPLGSGRARAHEASPRGPARPSGGGAGAEGRPGAAEVVTISVADDFSRVPGGRHRTDGPCSAERFRDDFLAPPLKDGIRVVVEMDGTMGYGSSFLDEAFGGLVRVHGLDPRRLHELLEIRTIDRAWKMEIWEYIGCPPGMDPWTASGPHVRRKGRRFPEPPMGAPLTGASQAGASGGYGLLMRLSSLLTRVRPNRMDRKTC